MRKLTLVITLGFAMSLTAFAGGHRIYMTPPNYDAINDFLEERAEAQYEAQYEAQIQAQIDALAQRQQYIESLLNQYDKE